MLRVPRELLVQVADDDPLVLQEETSLHKVLQRGEAHLDSGRDHGEDHREAEAHVPHDGAPHEPPTLVLAVDVGADKDGDGVRPGYAGVLVPPALHDDGDVEAQHEGERDQVAVRLAVLDHGLEHCFLLLVQSQAVRQVEGVVEEQESGEVRPHELVDAAPPSSQELEETPEAPASCDLGRVRHRHAVCCSSLMSITNVAGTGGFAQSLLPVSQSLLHFRRHQQTAAGGHPVVCCRSAGSPHHECQQTQLEKGWRSGGRGGGR